MTDMDHADQDLDKLFAKARLDYPAPSQYLLARVVEDAARLQPNAAVFERAPPPTLFERISERLGGWPAMAGLVTATIAGFWIGVSPPAVIDGPAAALFETTDALAVFDAELSSYGWDMEDR